MRIIFPIFAILAVLVYGAAAPSSREPEKRRPARVASRETARDNVAPASPRGQALVEDAIARMEERVSISAKVRQEIDLFGQSLLGTGSYTQQGRGVGRHLRWELKISGDQVSSLQQVCDGQHLWIHRQLLGKSILTRVDVTRVRLALEDQRARGAATPAGFPLGGLPQLLEGLNYSFAFGAPDESQLDRQISVWVLEGRWRTARLAELLSPQVDKQGVKPALDTTKLPEHVPDRVVLMLGRDDLFPYRIEYWRNVPADNKKAPNVDRRLVVMKLFEVAFDAPVDQRQFEIYQHGDLNGADSDDTDSFLKSLGIDPEKQSDR